MHQIIVIGPLGNGTYHIGYKSVVSNTFYSINEFVSEAMAQAMAGKMNRDRMNNTTSEN